MASQNEDSSAVPGLTSLANHATAEELATKFASEIHGKNVVITGVSIGSLGFEAMRVIAPYARKIWAVGRSIDRTNAAISSLQKERTSAEIVPIKADLGDIKSVQAGAAQILSSGEPVHVIINNAMVSIGNKGLQRTAEGFESSFGANHLGHFVLVGELLPGLKAAAKEGSFSPRVVAVASAGHHVSGIQFDDPNYEKRPEEFVMLPVYGQSKTANILFVRHFATKFKSENILAFSLHPGAIMTTGSQAIPDEEWMAMGLKNADGTWNSDKVQFKTLAQGAATHIAAAFDPTIKEQTGGYLDDTEVHNERLAAHANNDELAERLWALSEKLTGVAY